MSFNIDSGSSTSMSVQQQLPQQREIRWLGYPEMDNVCPKENEWTDKMVRGAVVDLLKEMNQSSLARLSPLPQSMISNIVNSKYHSAMSNEKLKAFGSWHCDFQFSKRYANRGDEKLGMSRVTFHPDQEVPTLKRWYREHPLPSQVLLQSFACELNQSAIRIERPRITPIHLSNWWKNERQKETRDKKKNGNNVVRRFDGQGNVCQTNIHTDQSVCNMEVKSKVRKTVLGNRPRNTSTYQ